MLINESKVFIEISSNKGRGYKEKALNPNFFITKLEKNFIETFCYFTLDRRQPSASAKDANVENRRPKRRRLCRRRQAKNKKESRSTVALMMLTGHPDDRQSTRRAGEGGGSTRARAQRIRINFQSGQFDGRRKANLLPYKQT